MLSFCPAWRRLLLEPNWHTMQLHGLPCLLTAMYRKSTDLQEVMIILSWQKFMWKSNPHPVYQ